MPNKSIRKDARWIAFFVAFGFLVFFLLLRSQQYTAVDGPLRSLGVFHDSSLHLHGNNHLLYPFWIWVWTRSAALIGFAAPDWLAFIRLSQAMNAFCASVGIGMLYILLEEIAGPLFALLASLQFGLTTAMVLHATNAAEPVTGLLFSLCALGILPAVLRKESKPGFLLIGVFLTLALASYQAMALAAPMIAFACVCWPGTSFLSGAKRLLLVGAGGLLSVLAVYGWAYSSQGVPPKRMIARFLTLDGAPDVYGGFSASKIANVPFGLLRNTFQGVPNNYAGIRSLFRDPHAALWAVLALTCLILFAALGWLVATAIVSAVQNSNMAKSVLWAGISLSVLAVFFPTAFWGPLYDKLWLLPLATLAIAAAFAFRFSRSSPNTQRILAASLAVLVLVESAVNIPRAVNDHIYETAHLNDARDLSAIVNNRDFVVVDFDEVSVLWYAIWGYGKNSLILPASTRSQTSELLAKAAENQNGRLIFVGVLDQQRAAWDDFLGGATGISYAEFDCFRRKSVILRQYNFPAGPVSVRQLQSPFSCTWNEKNPGIALKVGSSE